MATVSTVTSAAERADCVERVDCVVYEEWLGQTGQTGQTGERGGDGRRVMGGENEYDGERRGGGPSLRIEEKVWTDRKVMIERGVGTMTTERYELGVVVSVDDIGEAEEEREGVRGASQTGHTGGLCCGFPVGEEDVESNADIDADVDRKFDMSGVFKERSWQGPRSGSVSQLETIVCRLGPMLWQNNDMEAYADFLTYNDPVDDCKPMYGSLLPLWDVDVARSRVGPLTTTGSTTMMGYAIGCALDVTSICWHSTDPSVFAVGLGCIDGTIGCSEGGGAICVYSVMDLHVPRARIDVDVGVMSVAFSPDGHLAGGLQDGGIVVVGMDEGMRGTPTIVRSRIDHNHLFPVWNVRWGERVETTWVIQSTSHDGLEGHWQLRGWYCSYCGLFCRGCRRGQHDADVSVPLPRITRVASLIVNQPDSYHAFDPKVFLGDTPGPFQLKMVCCYGDGSGVVAHGTLEGDVGINGTWHRHHTAPVYTVQTNPFDPRYVMAASLDGSLSFWRVHTDANTDANVDGNAKATMVLDVDVGEPIVDAQWSIQSSTICAVATETGNVCVFDLSVSKEVPMCSQHVSNVPPTCLRFTSRDPPRAATPTPTSIAGATTAITTTATQTTSTTKAATKESGTVPHVPSVSLGSTSLTGATAGPAGVPPTTIHLPTSKFTPATSINNLLVVGTSDGRIIWLKLSPNLRIAKNATDQEGNEDFWGGHDNNAGRLGKERDIADDTTQVDNLVRVLGSSSAIVSTCTVCGHQ